MKVAREFLAAVACAACALCIDISILFALTSVAQVHYLCAASIGFAVGTVVAWYLSVRFVFQYRRCVSPSHEFVYFALIGIVGLIINDAVIAFFVENIGQSVLIGKGAAAAITFGFNFSLRKRLLFSSSPHSLLQVPAK